jgi:hypothetical protein
MSEYFEGGPSPEQVKEAGHEAAGELDSAMYRKATPTLRLAMAHHAMRVVAGAFAALAGRESWEAFPQPLPIVVSAAPPELEELRRDGASAQAMGAELMCIDGKNPDLGRVVETCAELVYGTVTPPEVHANSSMSALFSQAFRERSAELYEPTAAVQGPPAATHEV